MKPQKQPDLSAIEIAKAMLSKSKYEWSQKNDDAVGAVEAIVRRTVKEFVQRQVKYELQNTFEMNEDELYQKICTRIFIAPPNLQSNFEGWISWQLLGFRSGTIRHLAHLANNGVETGLASKDSRGFQLLIALEAMSSKRERDILYHLYVDRMSIKKIAKILEITEREVKKGRANLRRILSALREMM